MPVTIQSIVKASVGSCKHYIVTLADGVQTVSFELHLDELQGPISEDDLKATLKVNMRQWRQQGGTPNQMVGKILVSDL